MVELTLNFTSDILLSVCAILVIVTCLLLFSICWLCHHRNNTRQNSVWNTNENILKALSAGLEIRIEEIRLVQEQDVAEGGYAFVYKGIWRGKEVAMKEFKCTLDLAFRKEFVKELSILKEIRHPNCLLLMGVCMESSRLCLITEFAPLGSLFDTLHIKKVQLSKELFIKILTEIALGMNYLHMRTPTVIHMDLKSANVLIFSDFTAKISDFGSCKTMHSNPMPQTGSYGTPQYSAPELLKHEEYNETVDVYSWGILVWETLTGVFPYPNISTHVEVTTRVRDESIRPEIPVNSPRILNQMMQSAWHQQPSHRPSFSAILIDLSHFAQSKEYFDWQKF